MGLTMIDANATVSRPNSPSTPNFVPFGDHVCGGLRCCCSPEPLRSSPRCLHRVSAFTSTTPVPWGAPAWRRRTPVRTAPRSSSTQPGWPGCRDRTSAWASRRSPPAVASRTTSWLTAATFRTPSFRPQRLRHTRFQPQAHCRHRVVCTVRPRDQVGQHDL